MSIYIPPLQFHREYHFLNCTFAVYLSYKPRIMANKTARLGNAASDVVVAKVAVSGALTIRSTASASLPPVYPTAATLRVVLTVTHAVFVYSMGS
jgi:hypothetical protein